MTEHGADCAVLSNFPASELLLFVLYKTWKIKRPSETCEIRISDVVKLVNLIFFAPLILQVPFLTPSLNCS